jgi:glyoxylase-like metal-dependent hydrolase (beta-lactamase superfamily II)
MQIDGYHIDILIQGFPGKSTCHGGLGWSTVALLRGHDRVALIDTGSFGMRRVLIERLAERELDPSNVTDLLLTHAHYDHIVNWTLFGRARIVIGTHELAWALNEPWGATPVAELYVRELRTRPNVHLAEDGEEVMPRSTARIAPGHTPGHLIFVLSGSERDVIFTGDAAKNRAELVSGRTDMTHDPAVSAATIAAIWRLWRSRPGNIVVPGHDIPMVQNDGRPDYVGKREALIKAWFGEDLETTTSFDLTVG